MNTSTIQATETPETLTRDMLREVAASFPVDPLRQFLIGKGYNPEDGWILILPTEEGSLLGKFVPDYVRISKLAEVPMTIKGYEVSNTLKSFNHE